MAQISVEEQFRDEGGGAKYGCGGIMGAVAKEIVEHGIPNDYDLQTWVEMLIVKCTLAAAEQMKNEGDFVSGMTDTEPPSCYAEAQHENS